MCHTASTSSPALAVAAHQLFLAAAAHGEGAKDDVFVIPVWQALTGIELPKKAGSD